MATWEPDARMVERYVAGDAVAQIAADFGMSIGSVVYHARQAGVPRRRGGPPVPTIGECSHCATPFVRPATNPGKKYCSPTCRSAGTGAAITAGKIKQARSLCASGYWDVHVPAGHVSRTGRRKKRYRAPEHVMIAEGVLGRPLKKGEVVHHINCDKLDNRNENLLICTREYHAWLHGEMSRRYAQEKFGRVA